jgi:hypothetical protein
MKGGAWEIESSEFGSTVLAMVGPAVSQDAENIFWVVLLLLQKLLLLLWFRAGQGSITAAHKLLLLLWLLDVDGVFAKVLYDNAAIGGYIKVTGTTVTSANIAAECANLFCNSS